MGRNSGIDLGSELGINAMDDEAQLDIELAAITQAGVGNRLACHCNMLNQIIDVA